MSAEKKVSEEARGSAGTTRKKKAEDTAHPSTRKSGSGKPASKTTKQAKLKDPAGGLTAAGRRAFAEKDGSHLRPGVQGAADTPEKMKRKGSFLTRHFTHPRGPMIKDGEPTRLALSAHAWGEPVPKTVAAAQRLAAKGRKLLEQYHRAKDAAAPSARPARPAGAAAKKSSATRAKASPAAPRKSRKPDAGE